MTTKFDDADLGETLYIAAVSRDCGFKSVKMDTQDMVDLLTEFLEIRAVKLAIHDLASESLAQNALQTIREIYRLTR